MKREYFGNFVVDDKVVNIDEIPLFRLKDYRNEIAKKLEEKQDNLNVFIDTLDLDQGKKKQRKSKKEFQDLQLDVANYQNVLNSLDARIFKEETMAQLKKKQVGQKEKILSLGKLYGSKAMVMANGMINMNSDI